MAGAGLERASLSLCLCTLHSSNLAFRGPPVNMILVNKTLRDTATTIAGRLARLTGMLCVVGIVLLAAGCASESESRSGDGASSANEATAPDSTLVEAQHVGTIPVDILKEQTPEAFAALKPRAAYDVDAYRVVYETEDLTTGETTEVSGAHFVPQAEDRCRRSATSTGRSTHLKAIRRPPQIMQEKPWKWRSAACSLHRDSSSQLPTTSATARLGIARIRTISSKATR